MTATDLYEVADRTVKLATTYTRKAVNAIHWQQPKPDGSRGWLPLVGYWTLLDTLLDAAQEIVEVLPDDYFEESEGGTYFGITQARYNSSDEWLEGTEKLLAAIKARREGGKRRGLIERLENVEGRTPEEAQAFLAKAKELRG